MEKQMIWYEVHRQYKDGKIEWNSYLAQDGYSKYYENNLRYNLEDARAHAEEVMQCRPREKWVVIEVNQTAKLM